MTATDISLLGTMFIAFFIYLDWRSKLISIKTEVFPPIIGTRNHRKNYIFYLYCVNEGSTTSTIKDIQMEILYKNGQSSFLERIRNIQGGARFRTSTGDEINLDYGNKKFQIGKPLKQGKPVRGFVVFEETTTEEHNIINEFKISVEDVFSNVFETVIPLEKITLTSKNLSQLAELADITIPESAVR